MRTLLWLSAVSLTLVACLPQYEDPPLTATGEAGEAVKSSSSSSSTTGGGTTETTTGTCSGVVTGNLSETSTMPNPPPCTVNGTVTVSKVPSAKFKAVLVQIKSISALNLSADVDFTSTFPKLATVATFQVNGGGAGKTMTLPNTLKTIQTLSVSGTQLLQFNGNGSVVGMQSFVVDNNPQLKAVSGFPSAKNLGSLYLDHCPEITSFTGFHGIFQLTDLHIDHVGKLSNLGAFTALTNITTALQIGSTALTQLNQFQQLQTVPTLTLYQMPAMASPQFPNLTTVSTLNLVDMPQVSSMNGFDKAQVSKQATICVSSVPCTELNNWLAKHVQGQVMQCTGPACKS
ncbi:MAG: hypothetical protein HY902_06970 [Deltaproteobacteria bacterium]|nr:hypothetical protein [Deltaproteobacteria bacterium]